MPVTWNSADKHAEITLSGSDLIATNASGGKHGTRATLGRAAGKWYWEIAVGEIQPSGNYMCIGVGTTNAPLADDMYEHAEGWSYRGAAGKKGNNSVLSSYGDPYDANVIGIALDIDAGKIWWSKNGVWQAGGDPGAGTDEAFSGLTGTLYPMLSIFVADNSVTANFGASAFSYSIPSGFTAYGIYAGDVVLPALIIEWSYQAYGHDGIALPMLTVSAEVIPPNLGTAEVTLPGFSAEGVGGTPVRVDLPALTIEAIGGIGTEVRLDFPALTISSVGGGQSRFTLPILTLESTGTKGEVGSSDLVLPILSIAADGVVQLVGSADLDLLMLSFTGVWHVGEVGSLESDVSMLTVEATGWPDITGVLEDEDLALLVLGNGSSFYRFWDHILRHER